MEQGRSAWHWAGVEACDVSWDNNVAHLGTGQNAVMQSEHVSQDSTGSCTLGMLPTIRECSLISARCLVMCAVLSLGHYILSHELTCRSCLSCTPQLNVWRNLVTIWTVRRRVVARGVASVTACKHACVSKHGLHPSALLATASVCRKPASMDCPFPPVQSHQLKR